MMMDDEKPIIKAVLLLEKIYDEYDLPGDLQFELLFTRDGLLDRLTKPDRKWVGLTSKEVLEAWHWGGTNPVIEGAHFVVLYQYFEDKLKEKNYDNYLREKYTASFDGGNNV